MRFAKTALPPPLFGFMEEAKQRLHGFTWRMAHPGQQHSCPFCRKQFGRFIPYVNRFDISVEADIVSGQSIEAYECPCCHCYDRARALYFYIRDNIALAGKRILHLAPERGLHSLIAGSGCAEYLCGDLNPRSYYSISGAVRKIDLLAIDLADQYFDVAICNHTLEHIRDDITAMKEIFRILKVLGVAILLVPIGAKLDRTYEDASKVTRAERAQAFGQDDHVRIYSEEDFLRRLRSVGFDTRAEKVRLGDADLLRYGINTRERIYVAIRPA